MESSPCGVIKVNWDASLNVTKGWIGLGIIARDSSGFCLGARSVTKQMQVPPKRAEILAALQAVQFSKEVGFMDVIFEGDAAQIVKEIQSEHHSFSRIGHLLECIHSEMRSFRMVSFSFIPCDCNRAANILAKEASYFFSNFCWLEETPLVLVISLLRNSFVPRSPLLGSLLFSLKLLWNEDLFCSKKKKKKNRITQERCH
jgi:ribonuclease HI